MASVLGTTYDNVRIRILGIERNCEAFDDDYGREEPEDLRDASGKIVGFGMGSKRAANFSFEMLQEEFEAVEAPARLLGKDLTDCYPFPITVSYWDNVKDGQFFKMAANALRVRTLVNCVVNDVSQPHRRGDKKLVVTVKGKATELA